MNDAALAVIRIVLTVRSLNRLARMAGTSGRAYQHPDNLLFTNHRESSAA